MTSVVIVGAGVGGLTLAARLAHAGYRVTVVEKNAEPGGRVSRIVKDGFHFDMGPTILLMPDVYVSFFRDLGRDIAHYVQLEAMRTNYRVYFPDGSTLDVTPDQARMEAGLEAIEPGSAKGFRAFMATSGERYWTSRKAFVERRYDHVFQFLNPSMALTALRIGALGRLYSDVSRHFRDERLRQTFSFQSMYLGTSPTESPATFSLLPWTELFEGILFPKGGIYALIQAFQRVGTELGVQWRFSAPVAKVDDAGVTLASGERIDADLVVVNADLAGAVGTLVDDPRRYDRAKYTSSAVMFYIGLDRQLPGFEHHSVFFGEEYLESFDALFRRGELPGDPAFYTALPNRSDPSLAPPGGDALYVLVPAPSLPADGEARDLGVAALRERVLDRIGARAGFDLRPHIVTETVFTPKDWRDTFGLARGACFGLAHDVLRVGALRPAPKAPGHDNVYYVGASTRPGTGVPLVMIGARLVADQIREEHPLVRPDWEGVARVTETHARTFSLAARFLPGETRRAAQAVYAWFRRMDDAVDEPDGESIDALEAAIDRMERGGPAPDGGAAAMAVVMAQHGIPWDHVRTLLRGMRDDQGTVRLRDWSQLYTYAYRVAGVVGLVMARLFGARSREADDHAVSLGVGMQLANILRDVGEDLGRDRVYLPRAELHRYGIDEAELFGGRLAPADGPVDPRWRAFMESQVARARRYFADGLAGVPYLKPFLARWCVAVMGLVYGDILTAIEADGYRVFDRRARVGTWRKLGLVAQAFGVALGRRPERSAEAQAAK